MITRNISFLLACALLAILVGVHQTNAAGPEPRWVVAEMLELGVDVGVPVGAGLGPEDIVFDDQGRMYTGIGDGRILRFQPDGSGPEVYAQLETRPLGMRFDATGNLIVCASRLLSIAPDGSATALSPEELDGVPIRSANDLDIAADGTIYFSNSTHNVPPEEAFSEIFGQPGPYGRLYAYDPETGTTRVVVDGLWFANGVTLSPDGSFVLVAELTGLRVTRHWLTGPKQGESEVFIDNLPIGLASGLPPFPDNISSNGVDLFWLVVGPPGIVLGLDMDGNIVHHLNVLLLSGDPYGGLASVEEHEGMLYLGNWQQGILGRMSLGAPGPEDFTNVFFMDLAPGLSMISLPLEPAVPYTARSLAARLGATMVTEYDEVSRQYVDFTPDAPGDGFGIEGGKGYIINVPDGGVFAFVGAAWTNNPLVDMAPPDE